MAYTKQQRAEYGKQYRAANHEKLRAAKQAWRAKHKDSELKKQRDYRRRNRARMKAYLIKYNLKAFYGLDVEEYDRLFTEQEGCCVICGRHQTEFSKRLCVDHCHNTSAVRRLLCSYCNSGLGMFQDDPDRLRTAADYIEAHR